MKFKIEKRAKELLRTFSKYPWEGVLGGEKEKLIKIAYHVERLLIEARIQEVLDLWGQDIVDDKHWNIRMKELQKELEEMNASN